MNRGRIALGAILAVLTLVGCGESRSERSDEGAPESRPAIVAVADASLLPVISEIGAASGRSIRYARTSDPAAVEADLVFGEYHQVRGLAPEGVLELFALDPILLVGGGPGLPEPGRPLGLRSWQSVLLATATRRGGASFAIGDPARDVAALAAGLGIDDAAVSSAVSWFADLLLSGVGRVSPVPPSALGEEASAGLFRLSSLAGLQDLAGYPLPGATSVVAEGFAIVPLSPAGSALLPDLLVPEVLEEGLRARRLLPLAAGLVGSRLLQGEDAWASGARLVYEQLREVPLALLDRTGLDQSSEDVLTALESGRDSAEIRAEVASRISPYP